MLANSLGPWALDSGPSNPVTTHATLGKCCLNNASKGSDVKNHRQLFLLIFVHAVVHYQV